MIVALVSLLLSLITTTAIAAEEAYGFVQHWSNEKYMDRPFYFDDVLFQHWEPPTEAPPVSIQTANEIMITRAETRYPGMRPYVWNYRLVTVIPKDFKHSIWDYVIEYNLFGNLDAAVRKGSGRSIAVTMNEIVVETQCDAP